MLGLMRLPKRVVIAGEVAKSSASAYPEIYSICSNAAQAPYKTTCDVLFLEASRYCRLGTASPGHQQHDCWVVNAGGRHALSLAPDRRFAYQRQERLGSELGQQLFHLDARQLIRGFYDSVQNHRTCCTYGRFAPSSHLPAIRQ